MDDLATQVVAVIAALVAMFEGYLSMHDVVADAMPRVSRALDALIGIEDAEVLCERAGVGYVPDRDS